jgi:hypothetical protein
VGLDHGCLNPIRSNAPIRQSAPPSLAMLLEKLPYELGVCKGQSAVPQDARVFGLPSFPGHNHHFNLCKIS